MGNESTSSTQIQHFPCFGTSNSILEIISFNTFTKQHSPFISHDSPFISDFFYLYPNIFHLYSIMFHLFSIHIPLFSIYIPLFSICIPLFSISIPLFPIDIPLFSTDIPWFSISHWKSLGFSAPACQNSSSSCATSPSRGSFGQLEPLPAPRKAVMRCRAPGPPWIWRVSSGFFDVVKPDG